MERYEGAESEDSRSFTLPGSQPHTLMAMITSLHLDWRRNSPEPSLYTPIRTTLVEILQHLPTFRHFLCPKIQHTYTRKQLNIGPNSRMKLMHTRAGMGTRREMRVEGGERLRTFEVVIEVGRRRERGGDANEPVTTAARSDAPTRPSHHAKDESPWMGGEGQDRGGQTRCGGSASNTRRL